MASSRTRQRGTTRAADVTARRDHTPVSHQDRPTEETGRIRALAHFSGWSRHIPAPGSLPVPCPRSPEPAHPGHPGGLAHYRVAPGGSRGVTVHDPDHHCRTPSPGARSAVKFPVYTGPAPRPARAAVPAATRRGSLPSRNIRQSRIWPVSVRHGSSLAFPARPLSRRVGFPGARRPAPGARRPATSSRRPATGTAAPGDRHGGADDSAPEPARRHGRPRRPRRFAKGRIFCLDRCAFRCNVTTRG
jgi:hypothetical protein